MKLTCTTIWLQKKKKKNPPKYTVPLRLTNRHCKKEKGTRQEEQNKVIEYLS